MGRWTVRDPVPAFCLRAAAVTGEKNARKNARLANTVRAKQRNLREFRESRPGRSRSCATGQTARARIRSKRRRQGKRGKGESGE